MKLCKGWRLPQASLQLLHDLADVRHGTLFLQTPFCDPVSPNALQVMGTTGGSCRSATDRWQRSWQQPSLSEIQMVSGESQTKSSSASSQAIPKQKKKGKRSTSFYSTICGSMRLRAKTDRASDMDVVMA